MPKSAIKVNGVEDLTEPSDNDDTFKLNLAQLNFIKNNDNINFMNEIRKLMKKYDLDLSKIAEIIEDYKEKEAKRIERNEARRLNRQAKQEDKDDDVESILSSRSGGGGKHSKRSKRNSSRRR